MVSEIACKHNLIQSYSGKIFLQYNKMFYNRSITVNVFTNPLRFYITQIINPFFTSMLSANQDKGLGF